jgi:hypothetical protein
MFHPFEDLFHLQFGVVDAGFDGPLGAADDLGNFQDGKILKKVQSESFAMLDAETA